MTACSTTPTTSATSVQPAAGSPLQWHARPSKSDTLPFDGAWSVQAIQELSLIHI